MTVQQMLQMVLAAISKRYMGAAVNITRQVMATLALTALLLVSWSNAALASDYVSVKDYGAVGNGIADDTAAINTAIAASQGKTLFIPAGRYKISSTINFGTSVSVLGEGSRNSVFVLTHSGTGITIDYPDGTNYIYSQTFEKFGIIANINTTAALYMRLCIYCNFKDLSIQAPAALSSNFIGYSIAEGMYVDTFENCIFDTIEQTPAPVGTGWRVGNGQGAMVNANTFITCRAVRIGTGIDVFLGAGCIFINTDTEVCAVAGIYVRGGCYNKFIGPWMEECQMIIDQYNGNYSHWNTVTTTFPINVTVNSAYYTSFDSCSLNNITIGANASNTRIAKTVINQAIVNNGTDGNLEYSFQGVQNHIIQQGSYAVSNQVYNNGDTKITMNANQFIESLRFGPLTFSSDSFFKFTGAAPVMQINMAATPGNSPADSAYLFVIKNGSGKMQIAARFPSGAVQVIATEP